MYMDMHYFVSLSNHNILSSPFRIKEPGFIEIIGISKELKLGLDINGGFKLSLSLRFSLLNRLSGNNNLRGTYFSASEDDLGY